MAIFECAHCQQQMEVTQTPLPPAVQCPHCGQTNSLAPTHEPTAYAPPPPTPPAFSPTSTSPAPTSFAPPKTSGLAIAAFIISLLSCTVIGALVALILGIIAIVKIARSQGQLKGQPFAIAATAIAGLAILVLPLLVAIAIPAFAGARQAAKQTLCLSNLHSLGLAVSMYQLDYQVTPPTLQLLSDAYIDGDLPSCPFAQDQNLSASYVYRGSNLPEDIPNHIIIAHDRYPHPADPFDDQQNINVLFADGSVRPLTQSEFDRAIQKDNQTRKTLNLPQRLPELEDPDTAPPQ